MDRGDPEDVESLLEAERSRLADLLHDGPLSGLLAIRQDLMEREDPALDPAIEALNEIAHQVRAITRANQRDLLATVPLDAAIGVVAQGAAAAGHAEVVLDLHDAEGLAAHAALVRSAVRELTTNAVRHGRARRVAIASRHRPEGDVELVVDSDGSPIDPDLVRERGREGHLGLLRLARRVAAAGGSLVVGGAEHPAAVALRLPLDAPVERDVGFHADPWVIVRADLGYAHVSDAMAELVGWSREEMLAIAPDERPWFVNPDARARRRRIATETLSTGSYVAPIVLRHRDGHHIPTLATSHLLRRRREDDGSSFLALFRVAGARVS